MSHHRTFMLSACIHVLVFLLPATIPAQWVALNSTSPRNLIAVTFPENDREGYVAGAMKDLLLTTDGGVTWTHAQPGSARVTGFQSVHARGFGRDIVITGTEDDLVDNKTVGVVLTSRDGSVPGEQIARLRAWSQQLNQWNVSECRAHFPVSPSTGYLFFSTKASIRINEVWKCEGPQWTMRKLLSGELFIMRCIHFHDDSTGLIMGSQSIEVSPPYSGVGTSDAGATWYPLRVPTSAALYGITALSRTDWFAVGENGTILKTTDAGLAWTLVPSGTTAKLNDVVFPMCSDTGVIVGDQGAILTTADRGEHWQVEHHPSGENLNAVTFPPNQTKVAYIAGANGTLLKHSNFVVGVDDGMVPECSPLAMSVFPTVISSHAVLEISASVPRPATVVITNLLGVEEARMDLDAGSPHGPVYLTLAAETLNHGIHLIRLSAGRKQLVTKVLVVR